MVEAKVDGSKAAARSLSNATLKEFGPFVELCTPTEYVPGLSVTTTLESNMSLHKMTQVISNRIEEIVRAHPENEFWVHNRRKRQPLHGEVN